LLLDFVLNEKTRVLKPGLIVVVALLKEVLTVVRATSFRTPKPFRHHLKLHDPVNLSILLTGGKENNNDSLSSGERTG